MATYTTTKTQAGSVARSGLDLTCQVGQYTVVAGSAAADVIQMVKVPAGATIVEIVLFANASVAGTFTVGIGDGASTGRFLAAATAFAAGAAGITRATLGIGYTYTAEDTIDLLFGTVTTPVAGTVITLVAFYTLQA